MKKLLFAICLALSFHAHAVKFEVLPIDRSNLKGVYITGSFAKGDFENLERLMTNYDKQKVIFFVDSIGGNVGEAMFFGAYMFDHDIPVGILNKKNDKPKCLSACALAFLAAKRKLFGSEAMLGVHMFYSKPHENVGKTAAQIAQEDKAWVGYVNEYAKVTKIHPEAMATMYRTPSSTMYFFNRRQMEKYGAVYVD